MKTPKGADFSAIDHIREAAKHQLAHDIIIDVIRYVGTQTIGRDSTNINSGKGFHSETSLTYGKNLLNLTVSTIELHNSILFSNKTLMFHNVQYFECENSYIHAQDIHFINSNVDRDDLLECVFIGNIHGLND